MRQAKWQEAGELLKGCDIIVGGLDHIGSKDELEAFCRRFMIPYIDMGMDVTPRPDSWESLVSGQVVLSTPGEPCLRCLQRVTEERLNAEAQRYGAAGCRPQVVWPNGALRRPRRAWLYNSSPPGCVIRREAPTSPMTPTSGP
jgi:molybdopterin-synthase adenylyltransferase